MVGGSDAYTDADAAAAATATAGFLFQKGALDFAGGTVVHINAGIAGLVGALMLGKRDRLRTTADAAAQPPTGHDRRLAALGRLVRVQRRLGSRSQRLHGHGLRQHHLATAAAAFAWTFAEWIHRGTPTMLGAASGAVAGLVAITPACGWVGPMGSIAIGLIAGLLCLAAVAGLKHKLGYDDSLDVFGVHASAASSARC